MSDIQIEDLVFYNEDISLEPETNLLRNEQQKLVQKILEKLPEVYKETFIFRYYYNYSVKEIAKIMDVSPKTVEQRLYRGKQKLVMLMAGGENE